jgi:integrase
MQDVSIRGFGRKVGRKTEAYSFHDAKQFFTLFDGQTAAIIATSAFAGLRPGEVEGLQAESYDGKYLFIGHAVAERKLKDTKTHETPEAPGLIPVIAPLRRYLDPLRPPYGFFFRNSEGGRIDLSQHCGPGDQAQARTG